MKFANPNIASENQIGKEYRQQNLVREELVINSFANGLDIDLVAKITNLSREDIEEIYAKTKK
jgi:hypothetical protein